MGSCGVQVERISRGFPMNLPRITNTASHAATSIAVMSEIIRNKQYYIISYLATTNEIYVISRVSAQSQRKGDE